MKRFLILLILVGAAIYFGKSHDMSLLNQSRNSEVISDPVYAVIRFRTQFHDRTIDAVMYGKADGEADCKHASDDFIQRTNEHATSDVVWELVSSECEKNLEPRNLRLFENKPTFTNYISATAGGSDERDWRLIYWGVTAQEGDAICGEIPRYQQRWKGTISCIRGQLPQ